MSCSSRRAAAELSPLLSPAAAAGIGAGFTQAPGGAIVTLVCAHADVAAKAATNPANALIMHRFPELARDDSARTAHCKAAQPERGTPIELKPLDF